VRRFDEQNDDEPENFGFFEAAAVGGQARGCPHREVAHEQKKRAQIREKG
jgi:hypothetical protein